jgi:hypothetical protein
VSTAGNVVGGQTSLVNWMDYSDSRGDLKGEAEVENQIPT